MCSSCTKSKGLDHIFSKPRLLGQAYLLKDDKVFIRNVVDNSVAALQAVRGAYQVFQL
jgi:hypothetical protein